MPGQTLQPYLIALIAMLILAGCTTTQTVKENISRTQIEAQLENSDALDLPIKPGDRIGITLLEPIELNGKNAGHVNLIVDKVKPNSVMGRALIYDTGKRVYLEVDFAKASYIQVLGTSVRPTSGGSRFGEEVATRFLVIVFALLIAL